MGCLISTDLAVKPKNIYRKLPEFKNLPRVASWGVLSAKPSKKLIFALVDGI
jgi:hypothetical protein